MDTVNVYFHQIGGSYLHQSAIFPQSVTHTQRGSSGQQGQLCVCAEGAPFLTEVIIHEVHTGVCVPQTSCPVAFSAFCQVENRSG